MRSGNRVNYYEVPITGPLLIVVSGPSGVGKDMILRRMRAVDANLQYITTLTTRKKRTGEVDNEHYHFVSQGKFDAMIEENKLLEWANVYGNWYGVPREPVENALKQGRDTIVKVDIQGVATIKKIIPDAVTIVLMPLSIDELTRRLNQRSTETPFDLALRIKTAQSEVDQLEAFDYVVFNREGEADTAVSEIRAIITAEKCRLKPRKINLPINP
mgnify:CR=1 FL=1